MTAEATRLEEARHRKTLWKQWGPYLSERAWGTVREDYSPGGTAWDYFPHDHARSRAYRWNEDGLAGICDDRQLICFSVACWNGKDPILKERLFGLTGSEGNHGEDVKECYYYIDSTPTHSYLKCLYKYPQAAFPYAQLVAENRRRSRFDPEFELLDTGVFAEDRYFDITIEYAKVKSDDILIRITAINHGPDPAELHLIPTLWCRNVWSWRPNVRSPLLAAGEPIADRPTVIGVRHDEAGRHWLYAGGSPELLFTENETNHSRLFGVPNSNPYVKDGINEYIVAGRREAVNPEQVGTKAGLHYQLMLGPGQAAEFRLRLSATEMGAADSDPLGPDFEQGFVQRIAEADEYYDSVIPDALSADERRVMRQALAGLLWSKQFYHYNVREWLAGDPAGPPPPESRKHGRNSKWTHLNNADVISMPDKWEYPWYAAWDLAFHCVPLSLVDPDFAKEQLILMLREWYMHPNGQIPAYEWAFDDVNPPVHAWAAWRVYQIERRMKGDGDLGFLERVFHKLMLNFTWWVNRKDAGDNNIFEGGFLGLDNIGLFDRNQALPDGSRIEQSDGTSWMAMFCLDMLTIAMELARYNPTYEDVATKFLEHFVYIAHAMHNIGEDDIELWDEEDGFYYDVLQMTGQPSVRMKVRSFVGLVPLLAVTTLESEVVDQLPGFRRRLLWFLGHRSDLTGRFPHMGRPGQNQRLLISVVSPDRVRRILQRMLDESEFLSPHGIRSVSRYHRDHPATMQHEGQTYSIDYEPAESTTVLFGGNSNWRGPVWMPGNYLLIEALQRFHYYLGDDFTIEFPTGSGRMRNLWDIASELSGRLCGLFLRGPDGRRPAFGEIDLWQRDPHWRDLLLFHEYFHGDTGKGLGASHQTGWTGLVAKLLEQRGRWAGGQSARLTVGQAVMGR